MSSVPSVFVALVCIFQGSEALYNGILANPGDFPYMVFVGSTDGTVCGGSIISRSWVLTAAHCLLHDNGTLKTNVSVEIGNEIKLEFMMHGGDIQAEILAPHPDYKEMTKLHDIALLKVSPPFLWSSQVLPIQLETNSTAEHEGTAVMTGYGDTFHEEKYSVWDTRHLRTARVPMYLEACADAYINSDQTVELPKNFMLCTFGRHTGACPGDSGSPLVFQGVQIGVLALADEGCAPPRSTAHVRVSAYIDWIKEKCNDCLAESEVFQVFRPKPVRRPQTKDLKYQVFVTFTESIHVKPSVTMVELDFIWVGSIISEFWVLTANSSDLITNNVGDDPQFWVMSMATVEAKISISEWVPVIRMVTYNDVALAEIQYGFQWSELVAPIQLRLEPLNSSETGKMLVWEEDPQLLSVEKVVSSQALFIEVNFASAADCSEILQDDQAEFLCGHVENLHGLKFVWHMGSPVVLSNGQQIGISGESTSAHLYDTFDLVQIHIDWIQETCGGCLENYNEMTRKNTLALSTIFLLFMALVAVSIMAIFIFFLALLRLARSRKGPVGQAERSVVAVPELTYCDTQV